eukprot:CAMPEP_0113942744 /NCGR_PEP_ID=MMETSP1339-20121228/8958_1 /TAXON_ID=94617 /ORGANISM="Fibrocapsa japonica" /LENGTH=59 /DNA_ID=CAMNT_0000947319 /DNA_START=211 /DNA_END=390 /DNA_ORIENTATION=- /assembly_acc=CAM_ASM_000762
MQDEFDFQLDKRDDRLAALASAGHDSYPGVGGGGTTAWSHPRALRGTIWATAGGNENLE